MVRMRAISRFASFKRAVFSRAPVTPWKRRLKSSCRVSAKRCSSSSSVMSRSSLARKEISLPLHDPRLDRQLPARQAQRLFRQGLVDASELEHDPPGLDHGNPVLGSPLAGAHARLGGLLCNRLVREDVDPDLPAAADLARHRDSGGLDLPVRHPARLEGLEAVVPGLHGRLALREASAAASLVLAELRLLREQHQPSLFSSDSSPELSSFVGSSTCFLGVVVSGASTTASGATGVSGSTGGCSRPSAE